MLDQLSAGLVISRRALGRVGLLGSLVASFGCGPRSTTIGEVPAPTLDSSTLAGDGEAKALGPLVLAHAGQGSPASRSDGPAAAVERGHARLLEGDDPLAVAIAAVEVLEDDPRFNAGTGANLRIDGRTIETDAALMDDTGRFGAVAGISGFRHPIRVAEQVSISPHLLLAGPGAQAFAGTFALERADLATPEARARLSRGYEKLFASDPSERALGEFDWRAHWNFEGSPPADLVDARARLESTTTAATGTMPPSKPTRPDAESGETRDTVGVVVRSADGRYAAALSTGGTTLALRGRVGDVPLLGDGLYVGPHGAVAATGKGEAIIRERVAWEVYRRLAAGKRPADAIREVIRAIKPEEGVGVIAVSELGWAAVATSQMAWAARDQHEVHRADTFVVHRDR